MTSLDSRVRSAVAFVREPFIAQDVIDALGENRLESGTAIQHVLWDMLDEGLIYRDGTKQYRRAIRQLEREEGA